MGDPDAIPIRNVYALLAYAWDHLELADQNAVGATQADTPVDLLARLLAEGLRRLLRRGAHRAYLEAAEDLRLPRGRIEVGETVMRALRTRGAVHCCFDELRYDLPPNQVLKATARRLFACRDVPAEIAASLRDAYLRMSDVSDVQIDDHILRSVRPPRGQGLYGVVLDVCRLVHENLLPDETGGGYRLRDFTRDDRQMARLFEAFVRNFLRRELPDVRVSREHVAWADATGPSSALAWLPRMETDVSVVAGDTRTIVETKFYREPFQHRFDRERLRSAHLYQLFAYLKNLGAREPNQKLAGILLYAGVGKEVSASFRLDHVAVSVRTVDLMAPWPDLRKSLLSLPWAHREVNGTPTRPSVG